MGIEWRTISKYGNYEVSNYGDVRNVTTGSPLRSCSTNKYGHQQVWLYNKGVRYSFCLHRLVLTTFVGKCPRGMECRHLDGNPRNNSISNLTWGTHRENGKDSVNHGRTTCGERNNTSKLTHIEVLEIRRMSSTHKKVVLSKTFGVSPSNIWAIINRKSWRSI